MAHRVCVESSRSVRGRFINLVSFVSNKSTTDAYFNLSVMGQVAQADSNTHVYAQKVWPDYRKYLPGQLIRIRLKIEQNCRLFFDILSSAIINELFMTYIQA